MGSGEIPIELGDSWFSPNEWARGREITEPYQTKNARQLLLGSQTAGDKFRGQKGNSPDLQLRSLSGFKWERMWDCINSQDVGLEAAIH